MAFPNRRRVRGGVLLEIFDCVWFLDVAAPGVTEVVPFFPQLRARDISVSQRWARSAARGLARQAHIWHRAFRSLRPTHEPATSAEIIPFLSSRFPNLACRHDHNKSKICAHSFGIAVAYWRLFGFFLLFSTACCLPRMTSKGLGQPRFVVVFLISQRTR